MGEVPAGTALVASAAFLKGSLAIRVRDELGELFTDDQFADLFPRRGCPGLPPAMLALVLVLQFVEGLSDRQAADAVRGRIDWKYALGLELSDSGFDYSVLSEFRDRVVAGGAEERVLEVLLDRCRERGLLRPGGRQRTDSTHVLAATRELNRLELAVETLRCALNALAAAVPDWLAGWIAPEWFDRYGRRAEDYRLPRGVQARIDLAAEFGSDGTALLQQVHGPLAPCWLRELPAVQTLRQLWVQQFHVVDGAVRWRTAKDLPSGTARLTTAYDLEARCGLKRAGQRETVWHGYKAHLTETCEPDAPHLITHVATTVASVTDIAVVDTLHATLAERDLLPDVHVVDAGYVDGRLMVTARREHGVDLLGPMKLSSAWQKSDSGYRPENFTIDWDNEQVTCPNGKGSSRWYADRSEESLPVIRVEFRTSDCKPCPARSQCTTSARGRRMTLRHRAEHETIQQARADQTTDVWRNRYAVRHGIEGTISQAVRAFGLRRSRYRGLAKTRLQHLVTAAAINLARVDAWVTGTPFAPTRTPPLMEIRPAA